MTAFLRTAAALSAVALLAPTFADARPKDRLPPDKLEARFPSDFLNLPEGVTAFDALQGVLLDDRVGRVVFEKGVYDFSSTLFVFGRNDLEVCGSTGSPGDVTVRRVLDATVPVAGAMFQVEQAQRISFRDLTIDTVVPSQSAVRLTAATGTADTYADDVVLRNCHLRGYIGVSASVRASALTVDRCRFTTNAAGGFGLVWADGQGLFVHRSTFTTENDPLAAAAIFVQGAQDPLSDGRRANRVILSRNVVDGDFAFGFDLADVVDARVRKNRITFPGSRDATDRGRVGVFVRRASAPDLTENFELVRNRVRGAHFGSWIRFTGTGLLLRNDFRRCGSAQADVRFENFGGAVLVTLQGPCRVKIRSNDCRALQSPTSDVDLGVVPAITVEPDTGSDACDVLNGGNRFDPGRSPVTGVSQ